MVILYDYSINMLGLKNNLNGCVLNTDVPRDELGVWEHMNIDTSYTLNCYDPGMVHMEWRGRLEYQAVKKSL